MTSNALEESGAPPQLQALLRSIYGDGEAAYRAAIAPWPELGFRSALQERALFEEGAPANNPRRQKLEQLLRQECGRFAAGQPFFVSSGTTGAVRSPYPELTDAEFWLFVSLWEGEGDARRELESKYGVLDNQSGIEYLRRYRHAGPRVWVDRLLHGPPIGHDPLDVVYTWHCRNRSGVSA